MSTRPNNPSLTWIRSALNRLIWRIAARLRLRVFGIYSRAHDQQVPTAPNDKVYSWRFFDAASKSELIELTRDPELGLTTPFIHEALDKGDISAVIFRGQEVIAYDWSAFNATRVEGDIYAEFQSGDRYGYKSFTRKAFRGMHLRRIFVPERDRFCVNRGCNYSIAYIAPNNYSSIRSTQAIGYSRLGYAGYFYYGSIFIPFRTPAVKQRGFRFSRKLQRPPLP